MPRFLTAALGVALGFTIAVSGVGNTPPPASAEPAAVSLYEQNEAADAATTAQLAAAGIEVKRQLTEPVKVPYLPIAQRTAGKIGEVSCRASHPAFYIGVLYSQANAQGNTQGIQFCNDGVCGGAVEYGKNLVEMGGPWWGGGIRSMWWNVANNCSSFSFEWKGPNQTAWTTSRYRNGPYVINVWAPYPTQIRYIRYYCCY